MKLSKNLSLLMFVIVMGVGSAFAATTQTQTTNVTIASILSIEIAEAPDSTFGSGAIPWININPNNSPVPPTGHVITKSDVGLICRNNQGTWYLKIHMTGATLENKIWCFTFPTKVINRNTSTQADGMLNGIMNCVRPTPYTLYTSGSNDSLNTPHGTFFGIDYGLALSEQLEAVMTHTGTITYTITRSP
ncbi:MAG: hypothetical protein Q8N91_02735 [Candidatus Omnitrophota bacterium]|nr:hypothetical protein [Candidatus Omnitrophota bacterium]